jgi:hypothetical protein
MIKKFGGVIILSHLKILAALRRIWWKGKGG